MVSVVVKSIFFLLTIVFLMRAKLSKDEVTSIKCMLIGIPSGIIFIILEIVIFTNYSIFRIVLISACILFICNLEGKKIAIKYGTISTVIVVIAYTITKVLLSI